MEAKPVLASFLFLVVSSMPCMALADKPSQSPFHGLHKKVDALLSHVVACPRTHKRFVDNGDGTICDGHTGLMWEKKNAADGVQDLSNPHDVDNLYSWSDPEDGDFINPDGTVFTDFIAKLNGAVAQFVESEQLAGYRDWRVPTLWELQTLHPDTCVGSPCVVDPILLPTATFLYWSATSLPRDFIGPVYAWGVFFNVDGAIDVSKTLGLHARAVRGGR
jgi:hypothetical protein